MSGIALPGGMNGVPALNQNRMHLAVDQGLVAELISARGLLMVAAHLYTAQRNGGCTMREASDQAWQLHDSFVESTKERTAMMNRSQPDS